MPSVTIVGAGMAGMLAGAILRRECAWIIEAQPSLPNNHSALLRFRSPVVADVLGMTFRKVKVMKAVLPYLNPVADALSYSQKVTGSYSLRSIAEVATAGPQLVERYIAPDNFVQRVAETVEPLLAFNNTFIPHHYNAPIISTIPMPKLMAMLGYMPEHEIDEIFKSRSGVNISTKLIGVDAYATLYNPHPKDLESRISLCGDRVIVECYGEDLEGFPPQEVERELRHCLRKCGISQNLHLHYPIEVRRQTYAKILPIPEDIRRRFIAWATDEHGIYSLGRFATWRPGLLLDDLVNDVRVIQRLIRGEPRYETK